MKRSLIEISDLSQEDFFEILSIAKAISNGELPNIKKKLTIANLFYENSTRTRVSFELAAKRLGFLCTNIDIANSSKAKGEVFTDTISTLNAMAIDAFIIRHTSEILIKEAQQLLPECQFINAGNGMNAHPSQALLDCFTIMQHFNNPHEQTVVIIGDVRHSRVANSLLIALKKLGVKNILISAPDYFLPQNSMPGVTTEPSLMHALDGANVIYTLRVQKERIEDAANLPMEDYLDNYCLTTTKLAKAAKNKIIMHPGPINRGIEIMSDVADGTDSVILQQVQNGVYTRMAIMTWLLNQ